MHVAITGASSGIGEALAREYGKAGASLTLVARRGDRLAALSDELGGRACVVAKDLSDPAHAAEWLETARSTHGPIDVLINNAGIENVGPFQASDPAEALKVIQLNLLSPLAITHAALPEMIERRSGVIVQVSSCAAFAAAPGFAWYGASKAGLASASETLRAELRGTGVHVLTVYPGPITTAMADATAEKLGGRAALPKVPEGKPEVLAHLVRLAVERRQPRLVYPKTYAFQYWAPWLGRWLKNRVAA